MITILKLLTSCNITFAIFNIESMSRDMNPRLLNGKSPPPHLLPARYLHMTEVYCNLDHHAQHIIGYEHGQTKWYGVDIGA